MEELVSIVIPVFNRVDLVGRSINSALNQTYENIEIIIGDNCSTDGTWEILKMYQKRDSRIKIFRNSENIGPVRNWIECVKRVKSKYVKFLFSDDKFADDFIEKTLPFLLNNEVAFVFSPVIIKSELNIRLRYEYKSYSGFIDVDNYLSDLFLGNKVLPLSPGCALFRKIDIQENLLLNIENPISLDYSLYGAGNDLLLFLLPTLKYSKIYYVANTFSEFISHKYSFSISNNLSVYYLFARIYFLNISNKHKLISKYKSLLFLKGEKYYKYLHRKINIFSLFNIILIKIHYKLIRFYLFCKPNEK